MLATGRVICVGATDGAIVQYKMVMIHFLRNKGEQPVHLSWLFLQAREGVLQRMCAKLGKCQLSALLRLI